MFTSVGTRQNPSAQPFTRFHKLEVATRRRQFAGNCQTGQPATYYENVSLDIRLRFYLSVDSPNQPHSETIRNAQPRNRSQTTRNCFSLPTISLYSRHSDHPTSTARDRPDNHDPITPFLTQPDGPVAWKVIDMTDMTETPPTAGGLAKRLPLIVILIVAAIGAFTLRDYLSFQALAENREMLLAFRDANYLLAVLGFIGVYIVIVAFSLPGATIATLTGGFLFATFPGALFNVTAATLGATAIFLAARMGFGERLGKKLEASDGAIKSIKDGIDENQWSMLFLIRLVPAVPFFVANLLPAFLEVPLRRFVISTFLGIIPGAVVYTSVGAGLGEVFARGETPNLGIIFEPHILLPILGLCALAALPIVIKAVRGKAV